MSSKTVHFDTGSDHATRALQARARGQRAEVMSPEALRLLGEATPKATPVKQTVKA